jgi:hypothetical protein
VVPLIASVAGGGDIDPTLLLSVTPLMGVAAGLLLLRGRIAGAVAGVCFYAIQSISYFSPAFSFSFKSGLSLAAVFVLTDGVLIMNWAAFILGTLCAVLLWRPKLT